MAKMKVKKKKAKKKVVKKMWMKATYIHKDKNGKVDGVIEFSDSDKVRKKLWDDGFADGVAYMIEQITWGMVAMGLSPRYQLAALLLHECGFGGEVVRRIKLNNPEIYKEHKEFFNKMLKRFHDKKGN